MSSYIDRDALLKSLPDDLPYKASVKRVLIQAPTVEILSMYVVRKIHQEDVTKEFTQFVKEKMVKELGEYLMKNGFIRFSENIERDLYTILCLIQIVDRRSKNENNI